MTGLIQVVQIYSEILLRNKKERMVNTHNPDKPPVGGVNTLNPGKSPVCRVEKAKSERLLTV